MAAAPKSIEKQNNEFDAVRELAYQYARLIKVPVVDDEYPEYRFDYEDAVRNIIAAFKANGRQL